MPPDWAPRASASGVIAAADAAAPFSTVRRSRLSGIRTSSIGEFAYLILLDRRIRPPSQAHEGEVHGLAAFNTRLGFIASREPSGPGAAPIVGLGPGPAEVMGSEKTCERPTGVIVDIGCEAQLGVLPHDPRQRVDHAFDYQPPLVVPPFWPGIRVEHEHARKEGVWHTLDNPLCVAVPQAHIGKVLALEPRKRRDDPVEEWLTTDQPDIGIGFCLLDKMFAGAEPNFQPHLPGRSGEYPPFGEVFRRN